MSHADFTITGGDGQTVAAFRWGDAGTPKGAVQIAHGLAEHAARYGRVAERLVGAGYVVYANDHRAHGRTADEFGAFGVARPGGWSAIVDDVHVLTEHIEGVHPGVPIVLLGHSMGSMIAQGYAQRWGDDLAGLVLSGTTGGLALDGDTLGLVTALGEGDGADQPSEIAVAMFGGFNAPFDGPDATGFEWLSRDAAEVQKYVDDPWCGFPVSNGYIADMLVGTAAMWQPEAEANIRRDLPIYVMGGANDPVGGERAALVHELVGRYEVLGAGPVTLKLYADGRHEMLNEVNREEVESDLVAWIDATIAARVG
ncbi:MAG: alpha/beta fold hydrolase [Acidimicrobiia bacterium]|nr:alpha/beta fold hydrolase [Acidimicrobiia bacterium]